MAVEPELGEVKDENATKDAVDAGAGQTAVNMANNNAEPRKVSQVLCMLRCRHVRIRDRHVM